MDLLIIGGIVLGLVEVLKKTLNIKARYIPITTLALTGVIFGLFFLINKTPINWEAVQNGFIVALSAMGLWSGSKATFGK